MCDYLEQDLTVTDIPNYKRKIDEETLIPERQSITTKDAEKTTEN